MVLFSMYVGVCIRIYVFYREQFLEIELDNKWTMSIILTNSKLHLTVEHDVSLQMYECSVETHIHTRIYVCLPRKAQWFMFAEKERQIRQLNIEKKNRIP